MFDPAKIYNTPRQSELYYWADFVELLCITDVDGTFSVERLAEVAKFADDLQALSPDAVDADEADLEDLLLADTEMNGDYQADTTLSDGYNEEQETWLYEDFGRDAESTDDRRRWCQDIFRLLSSRVEALGSAYPFAVDPAGMRIALIPPSAANRTYVFLLACSLLPHFSKSSAQLLTEHFERFSAEVLRVLMPAPAVVDVYGTAGGAASQFTGTPYQRLQALAKELRGKVIASKADFHPRDRGDNGLDLVAWLPVSDPGAGVVSVFGQCACGRGWDGKQYEASHARWRNYLHLTSPSVTATFIPHYFRKPGHHWYSESDIHGFVVDRLRALRVLGHHADTVVPRGIVDAILAFKRPVEATV